jgi:hypothetical protein
MTDRPLRTEVVTLCVLAPVAVVLAAVGPLARFLAWRTRRKM